MTRADNKANNFEHVALGIAMTTRFLRKRLRLSQHQLAERANVSRSQISKLEICRSNPSIKTLMAIAAALGYQLDGFYRLALETADRFEMSAGRPA